MTSPAESHEALAFKDTELRMLVVSLKEATATKEVIQTLEQLLCEDTSQLEEERSQVCLLSAALLNHFRCLWSVCSFRFTINPKVPSVEEASSSFWTSSCL